MRRAQGGLAKTLHYQELLLTKNPTTGEPYKPWEAAMVAFPGGRMTKHNAQARVCAAKKKHGETVGRILRERGVTTRICDVLEEGLSALKPLVLQRFEPGEKGSRRVDDEVAFIPDHHERTRAAGIATESLGDMNRHAQVSAEANQYNLFILNMIQETKKVAEGRPVEAEVVETLPAKTKGEK